MKNKIKILLFITYLAFNIGCQHSGAYLNPEFEKLQGSKGIVVSSELGGLGSKIKNVLRKKGFKIFVDNGEKLTTKNNNKIHQRAYLRPDLKLNVSGNPIDMCITNGLPMWSYSISIIVTDTGEEYYSQNGRQCEYNIVNTLEKNLK